MRTSAHKVARLSASTLSDQRRAFFIKTPGPLGLEFQKPRRGVSGPRRSSCVTRKRSRSSSGKIHAAHLEVAANIANDVGELECEAQPLGQIRSARVVEAEYVQAGEADRARHAIAIFGEPVECSIGGDRQIHLRAENQVVEIARGNLEARDRVGERGKNRVAFGCARGGFVEHRAPPGEPARFDSRSPGSSETLSTRRMKA